jgi:hypothetical protein
MNGSNLYDMKRSILLILIAISLPAFRTFAQESDNERLNAFKIGFFTKRLELSTDEAEKFWPVYNEYQNLKNQVQAEKIKLVRYFNQNENSLSNAQVTEIGDKLAATIVKESELAANFHNKLREVLPPKKVIRFYQAENQYKIQLLNELQNRQKSNLQNRPLQNRPIQR